MTETNPSGAAAPSPYLDHDELERIAHPVPGTAYRDGGRRQTMAAEILRLRKRVADAGDDADRCLAREMSAVRDRLHLSAQIDDLAKVLLAEFGGPVGGSEGACDMAVRVLREQKAEIDRLRAENDRLRELFEGIDELMTRSMPGMPPLKPISGDWCGTNRPEMLPLTPKFRPATGEPRTEVAPGPDGFGNWSGSPDSTPPR